MPAGCTWVGIRSGCEAGAYVSPVEQPEARRGRGAGPGPSPSRPPPQVLLCASSQTSSVVECWSLRKEGLPVNNIFQQLSPAGESRSSRPGTRSLPGTWGPLGALG